MRNGIACAPALAATFLRICWIDSRFALRRHRLAVQVSRLPSKLLLLPALAGIVVANSALGDQWVQLDYNLTLQDHSRNSVFIRVFDDRPITEANFMQYVNNHKYDGTFMHRLAKDFVLQGGGYYPTFISQPEPIHTALDPSTRVDLDGNLNTPNPQIANEFNNQPARTNARGTLAMAKLGGNPNSATNEWFVNLKDNGTTSPGFLDTQNGGFTVFAQVEGDGMEFYDAVNTVSANGIQIANLNIDYNGDKIRNETGYAFDTVPVIGSVPNLVMLQKAARIDYYGANSTTNIPNTGLTFSQRDVFIDTGAAFTGTGRLIVKTGRTLGVREGITLGRPLLVQGTLEPGMQNGMIGVPSYEQSVDGTLEIQMRGTTVDSQYDRLAVTGQAKLNGKLKISLLNLYVPAPGSKFDVVTAGSFVGNFASLDLPTLPTSLFWDVKQTSTAVSVLVGGGDYNHDGKVDAADFISWKSNFGSSVTPYTGADGNGDGLVNAADYNIWRAFQGAVAIGAGSGGSGGLSVGEVPEPGTVTLLLMAGGVLALTIYRRRRAKG